MITTEEIKKELDAGLEVELKCVDVDGFLMDENRKDANQNILNQGRLIVERIAPSGDIRFKGSIECQGNFIDSKEFKYFSIKRPAPTFDDLIDVAHKALKDGLLTRVNTTKSSIEYWSDNTLPYVLSCHSITGKNQYVSLSGSDAKSRLIILKKEIDNINSLYTKEFVIESNEDIIELLRNDEIELTNGNVLICRGKAYEVENRWAIDAILKGLTNSSHIDYCLTLTALKGAKVTRKRGEAC